MKQHLAAHQHGDCLVVTLSFDRFDAALVPEFKREFAQWVNPPPKELALDMSAVKFVDSSALGALVGVYKACAGVRVRLIGVVPSVLGLLKLTRMDRVFAISDTLEPFAA
jgi:anti-sigma B factor antagonist